MNTKSKIGLALATVAVSLLFDVLGLNHWPTPGGYLVDLMLPSRPVETDWRIIWARDIAVMLEQTSFAVL